MLSQSDLNPVDVIAAKIQTRIATFLSLKEPLITLTKYPIDSISSEANDLYTVQGVLESQLADNLKLIDVMKSGAWNFSNVASLGVFYSEMEKHITNVHKLQDKAGITVQPEGLLPQDIAPYLPWILGGGVTIALLFLLKRR